MSREFGICGSSGDGGGLQQLGADLTWPSTVATFGALQIISGLDMSGSLQTALTATGKFELDRLYISSHTAELMTIKLTIDGVVVWNDTYSSSLTTTFLLGVTSTTSNTASESGKLVAETFLLEIETATDTSIDVNYILRPLA